jgi:hypothetical protein
MISEVEKIDKEIKNSFEKVDKIKEKYYKVCKDYEEAILQI